MVTQKIIRKKLKIYLKKVRESLAVDKAYLVGSWAKGTATESSDIDLVVLSKSFKRMDMDERLDILYRKSAGMKMEFHIHPVTEEEFKSASMLTSLGMMRVEKKILIS